MTVSQMARQLDTAQPQGQPAEVVAGRFYRYSRQYMIHVGLDTWIQDHGGMATVLDAVSGQHVEWENTLLSSVFICLHTLLRVCLGNKNWMWYKYQNQSCDVMMTSSYYHHPVYHCTCAGMSPFIINV